MYNKCGSYRFSNTHSHFAFSHTCTCPDLEWASVNLGIVLCIKCSGVHRGLGVHVSKVRSLNLDKWDKASVDFMQSQGNSKSNSYYEANLDNGLFEADTPRPSPNASKLVPCMYMYTHSGSVEFEE